MFKLKLGTDNSWKSQEGGGFRQGNDPSYNKISLSYNETGNYQYDVCVKIDSLSSRSNKLVEYGELFVCLAVEEANFFHSAKGHYSDNGNFGTNVSYFRTIPDILQQVIRGKNEYHFSVNKSLVRSHKTERAMKNSNKPYIIIRGRLLHIQKTQEKGKYIAPPDLEQNSVFDTLSFCWLGDCKFITGYCSITHTNDLTLFIKI